MWAFLPCQRRLPETVHNSSQYHCTPCAARPAASSTTAHCLQVFKESADSSDDPGDTLSGHYLDSDMLDTAMKEADEGATSAGYNKELVNWKEATYGKDYQDLDDGLGYDELGGWAGQHGCMCVCGGVPACTQPV
jgi:hypothetical protein